MTWLDATRGAKIARLVGIGLGRRDAKRTLLLAEASEPQPAPYSPLVGGRAHPDRLTVHRVDGEERFVCGTTRGRAYFKVEAQNVRDEDLEPCKRCYGL